MRATGFAAQFLDRGDRGEPQVRRWLRPPGHEHNELRKASHGEVQKKTKRVLIAAAIATVAIVGGLTLTACGGGGAEAEEKSEPKTPSKKELCDRPGMEGNSACPGGRKSTPSRPTTTTQPAPPAHEG